MIDKLAFVRQKTHRWGHGLLLIASLFGGLETKCAENSVGQAAFLWQWYILLVTQPCVLRSSYVIPGFKLVCEKNGMAGS